MNSGLRLPRKTAASAVHPLPLDIPGTNDERRNAYTAPLIALKDAAQIHEKALYLSTLIPFALRTSGELPVILKFNP